MQVYLNLHLGTMSDDEKSAKAGKPGNIALSEKEISVIAAMFRCMKEKPTVSRSSMRTSCVIADILRLVCAN